jgi:DNA-binding response OmpR family regulator
MEPTRNHALSESAIRPGERPRSIMVLNHEPSVAHVVQASLELQGWSIVVCSGREATRDIARLRPDVILLDFDGPGVDVFELLHALNVVAGGARVLVCSHFAEPTGPERAALRELGVVRWLRRPCGMQKLASVLDELASSAAELRTEPTKRAHL